MGSKFGYLLAADGPKYLKEAIINAKLLRKHSKYAIALAVSEEDIIIEEKGLFDHILFIQDSRKKKFAFKVLAMMKSPFERTMYLDTDALVIKSIDHIFEALDRFEIGVTIEPSCHTLINGTFQQYYRDVVPEWNSGVLLFKRSDSVKKLFAIWYSKLLYGIEHYNQSADMPYLREAYLEMPEINYFVLPNNYNLHGLRTFLIIYGEVFIIHERVGRSWRYWTPVLLDVDATEKLGKKLNIHYHKRLYIPFIGVISSRWSPGYIIDRLKMRFLPRVSRYTGKIVRNK